MVQGWERCEHSGQLRLLGYVDQLAEVGAVVR